MELICLENASHRKDRISSSINSLLHFISWPQLISQISKGQVCYQEQFATSRYSRGPSQSKTRKNPSTRTEAVYGGSTRHQWLSPQPQEIPAQCRCIRGMSWTGWDMSYISHSTTVLFEEGCLPSAIQSCLTLFPVCNTVTYWNHINWNNSKLNISPEGLGTNCWIHLNKDCQQKKYLPNHSCDLENSWSVTQFQLLYHWRSFIPWFITLFFSFSSQIIDIPFTISTEIFQIYTVIGKWEWKRDSVYKSKWPIIENLMTFN